MALETGSPTISLRERSFPLVGSEEPLPKWLVLSLALHVALVACLFLMPFLPTAAGPVHPVYVVDLIGGEKIGSANFGTELKPPPKQAAKNVEAEKPAPPIEKSPEKLKPVEKKAPQEEKIVLKEKAKPEPTKKETAKETKQDTKTESASADSVRERLLQSAVERAKSRSESGQKPSRGEVLSSGTGEGEGAAALGVGGRGGPGVVKGMDYIIYQNRMLSTIKNNWVWVGSRGNLKVVVHFSIKDNGDIAGLKIVQPSGNPSYDDSVLRAVRKSSPLPAPADAIRREFAEVEIAFRPEDLGS